MVEEMRAKWCNELEDLLKCPICFERPKIPVLQCLSGHHICNVCKPKMAECPYCKSGFSDGRSFLAQDLSMKLDDIKLSLIDPMHDVNRIIKKTVGSQTDNDVIVIRNGAKRARREPPLAPKGKFPCRLGTCDLVMPHGRMIPHIRYFHNNKFCESSSASGETYKQVWEMDYQKNTNFNLAIRITEMGLFFMHIKINEEGDLFGVVQIVSTQSIGKEFEYELRIESGHRCSSFKEVVGSCRTNPINLFEASDCLVIRQIQMQRLIANNDLSFTCAMIVNRLPKISNEPPTII